MMELLLGLSVLWLAYVYLGYPAILAALARVGGPGVEGREGAPEPSVSILIAAYNEEGSIESTVRNKLELDYPEDRLDIIVISDESSDATEDIVGSLVQEYPGRLRLIRQEPRRGKTSGLNLAVPEATGEILVFSDANSIYAPDALRHLVRAFEDPEVGYVTGKMIYTNPDGSVVGDGCTTYMRYENSLRRWESRVGSVVGVDGGIDAVRKALYRPMRADQLPDFVLPLSVVEQGYRVTYAERAILREETLASSSAEYRMRVRVGLRAMWALWDLRSLFDPRRGFVFAWQLFSHKLLRYAAFLPQALAFVSNAALIDRHPAFGLLFGLQVFFYFLALVGYLGRGRESTGFWATGPYYLTLLNVACAHATLRFLRGERMATWQPRTG